MKIFYHFRALEQLPEDLKDRRSRNVRFVDAECDNDGKYGISRTKWWLRMIMKDICLQKVFGILHAASFYSIFIYLYPTTNVEFDAFMICMMYIVSQELFSYSILHAL